jgi:hypothetical protein
MWISGSLAELEAAIYYALYSVRPRQQQLRQWSDPIDFWEFDEPGTPNLSREPARQKLLPAAGTFHIHTSSGTSFPPVHGRIFLKTNELELCDVRTA